MTVMTSPHRAFALGRAVRPITSSAPASPFRDVMAHLAAPVCVVTVGGEVGSGTTVSAVMSVSMEPEQLVVALAHSSSTLTAVLAERRFGVNLLAADQEDVALTFARKGVDKLAATPHRWEAGIPRLSETAGWVRCRVAAVHRAGDHDLVIGAVEAAHHSPGRDPLTYHSRTFGTHRRD